MQKTEQRDLKYLQLLLLIKRTKIIEKKHLIKSFLNEQLSLWLQGTFCVSKIISEG